jgi:hypothetical protein
MASYTESLNAQFREEFKLRHNLKKPTGPGRAQMTDWEAILAKGRRPSPKEVPISSKVPLAKNAHYLGSSNSSRSSSAIGSFWHDAVFSELAHDASAKASTVPPARKGARSQTSSEVGRFWIVDEAEIPAAVTAHNKAGSALENESLSSFNLEELPVQHRIL